MVCEYSKGVGEVFLGSYNFLVVEGLVGDILFFFKKIEGDKTSSISLKQ